MRSESRVTLYGVEAKVNSQCGRVQVMQVEKLVATLQCHSYCLLDRKGIALSSNNGSGDQWSPDLLDGMVKINNETKEMQ